MADWVWTDIRRESPDGPVSVAAYLDDSSKWYMFRLGVYVTLWSALDARLWVETGAA